MRQVGNGINWQWYYTDTKEEAEEWYKELTDERPSVGEIVEPVVRVPSAKYDDKYGFRLHK